MLTTDARGHRFPNQRTLSSDSVSIVDADIYGTLEPLNLHGPLFTSNLLAFGSHFRDTPRYTRDRLATFFNSRAIRFKGKDIGGPVIDRPARQFPKPEEGTPKRAMMIIHANNAAGDRVLKEVGRYHPIKHGGWWQHQVANSHITGSLHLSALDAQIPFIPPDQIAEDIGITVPYTAPDGSYFENHRLVPDYLMGIGRFFALETDLGNETGRPDPEVFHRKKSYQRMFLQYAELIVRSQDSDGTKLYNQLYRIPRNKPLMVLFVTTDAAKLVLMESIIMELTGERGCNWFLMKHVAPTAFSAYHKPRPLLTLWTEPWKRAGRPDFYINNMARQ